MPTSLPSFDGSTSGAAWWRLFAQWLAASSSSDNEVILECFESFMYGTAEEWYRSLPASDKTNWRKLRPLFIAKFPGNDLSLLPSSIRDPVSEFYQYLVQPIETKELLDLVDFDVADGSGRHEKLYRYQAWAYLLWNKCAKLAEGEIGKRMCAHLICTHMNVTLLRLVPASLDDGQAICTHVARLGHQDVRTVVENDLRLSSVETLARQLQAKQQSSGPYVTRSSNVSSQPVPPPGSGSPISARSATPLANVTNRPQPVPLQTHQHLQYSDSVTGHDAYAKALQWYDANYGAGMSLSVDRAFPLSPGTMAPGPGVCNNCGQPGHLQDACTGKPVPDRERRFRGMCALAMRKSKGVATNSIDVVPGPVSREEVSTSPSGNE